MLKKFEYNLNQKKTFLSIFAISFFLPNFDLTIRADHFAVYIFLLIFLFIFFSQIFQNSNNLKIATIFVKNNSFIATEVFLFISVIICLFLSTINSIFIDNLYDLFVKNDLINIFSSLAVLDNYLLNISIFVLSLFFFYKNTDETFYYFANLIVILLCINSVYSLFEVAVVNLDENCKIFKTSKQTIFCTIIAAIDVSYASPSFSNAMEDYFARTIFSPQVTKELLDIVPNSASIGWISLTAGRSGGIFNMPIESAIINAAGLLLIYILFLLDTKNNLKKLTESKEKFYCYTFFLLLLASILSVSKITSHFTLPVLFLFILFNRKKIKSFISSKYFKFSAVSFFIVLILLANLRWNGYNAYYQHALRYIFIICNEAKITCKFPKEIITSKESISAKEIGYTAKNIDYDKIFLESHIIGHSSNKIFQEYINNQLLIHNLAKTQKKEKSLVEGNDAKPFVDRINVYLNYISGGRHGAVDSQSIMSLKISNAIFGYGVIIQESFDQMKNYLIFFSGVLSYYLYLIFEILPFFWIIFYKKKFKNTKIPIILILIFSLYFIGSLGGPIYFMNRVSVIYFAALAYFLIKLGAIKNNKSNV